MKHRENMEISKQLPSLGQYFEEKDKEAFSKEIIRKAIDLESEQSSLNNQDMVNAMDANIESQKLTSSNNASTWTCPNCGKKDINENFCGECGTKRPSVITSWNCACGKIGISSKFCPNCGKERP